MTAWQQVANLRNPDGTPWLPGLLRECHICGGTRRIQNFAGELSPSVSETHGVECPICHGSGLVPIAPDLDALMRAAREAGYRFKLLDVWTTTGRVIDAEFFRDDDAAAVGTGSHPDSPLAAALAALLAVWEDR